MQDFKLGGSLDFYIPPAPEPDKFSMLKRSAYISQYGYWQHQYGVPKFHEMGLLGERIYVVICDTGVNPLDRINERIVNAEDYTFEGIVEDLHSHGTFIGCQLGGSHDTFGWKGTLPLCNIDSRRVLNSNGEGAGQWVNKAHEDLLDLPMEQGMIYMVNNSLGGMIDPELDRIQIELLKKGWIIGNAAGNEGELGMSHPGSTIAGISVGAVDELKIIAPFSSRQLSGQHLDLVDAGVAIKSYNKDGRESTWSGTSMATPNMLGKLGLIAEYDIKNRKKLYLVPWHIQEKMIVNSVMPNSNRNQPNSYGRGVFSPNVLYDAIKMLEVPESPPEQPETPIDTIPIFDTPVIVPDDGDEDLPDEEMPVSNSDRKFIGIASLLAALLTALSIIFGNVCG